MLIIFISWKEVSELKYLIWKGKIVSFRITELSTHSKIFGVKFLEYNFKLSKKKWGEKTVKKKKARKKINTEKIGQIT